MSAAALQVSVGSFSDGEIDGLAHFCEHMCFLGTEKFPDESSFSVFLNEHGGNSNAYTASEATNYHFDIVSEQLKGAFERFSSFFTCPLFTESATGRELNAVDSEHAKNLQNDSWRSHQLDQATSNNSHVFNHFGTGDSRTLRDEPAAKGVNVRQKLLDFHAAHYSASRMTLAVLGKESVDTLIEWTKEFFSEIKNNNSSAPFFPGHPYDGKTGLYHHSVPIKDFRSLSVTWAVPEQQTDWQTKAENYLSHLIGHEGPGSLLSMLKAYGLAEGLSAGSSMDDSNAASFNVKIDLSELGLSRANDVLACVYAYLGVLQAHGPQKWVWDEQAIQAASSFRFISKYHPVSYVTQLAENLSKPNVLTKPETLLTGPSLFWEFNADKITTLLARFTPENSRVKVSSKSESIASKCNLVEPIYGTKYSEEAMSSDLMQKLSQVAAEYKAVTVERMTALGGNTAVVGGKSWKSSSLSSSSAGSAQTQTKSAGDEVEDDSSSETTPVLPSLSSVGAKAFASSLSPPLTLPSPNDFLATDFSIRNPALALRKKADEERTAQLEDPPHTMIDGIRIRREPVPVLLKRDARCEAFFNQDDFFGSPKVSVHAMLRIPMTMYSPRNACILDLYNNLLIESLNEFTYAAEVAGLRFNAQIAAGGISLNFYGFSHKMKVLVKKVAQRASKLVFSNTVFKIQHDILTRHYANSTKNQPYQHAITRSTLALTTPCWTIDEKAAEIKSIDANAMRSVISSDFLRNVQSRLLINGNATNDEAMEILKAFCEPLDAVSEAPPAALINPLRSLQLPSPLIVSAAATTTSATATTAAVRVPLEFVYKLPARNNADKNGSMFYLVQVGPSARGPQCAQNVMVDLACHLLSEPYFDVLRTQQQLGYVVRASVHSLFGTDFISFLVQSDKVEPEELIKRTDAFLTTFVPTILSMPDEKFAANIKSVVVRRAEADKNLSSESMRLWDEVRACSLDFSRATHEAKALLSLTKAEVAEWFAEHISPTGLKRRTLITLIQPGREVRVVGEKSVREEDDNGDEDGGDDDDDEGEEDEEEEEAAEESKMKVEGEAVTAASEAKATSSNEPQAPIVHATLKKAALLLQTISSSIGAPASSSGNASVLSGLASAGLYNSFSPFLSDESWTGHVGDRAVRLRVSVDATDDSVTFLRALLPSYPDLRNAFYAMNGE